MARNITHQRAEGKKGLLGQHGLIRRLEPNYETDTKKRQGFLQDANMKTHDKYEFPQCALEVFKDRCVSVAGILEAGQIDGIKGP
jgi:hypothetical protein